jgi:hypothetical protein
MIYTKRMTVDLARVVELLSNSHLFRSLNDEQRTDLANQFVERLLAKGDPLFEEGDDADSFYLVYEGQVKLTQARGENTRLLARLVEGDYFGEEAFFTHRTRSATVTGLSDCILLRMDYDRFAELLHKIPSLKENLQVAISSRRMARRRKWSWLNSDEVVYVLARKHTFFLIKNLILPALVLVLGISLFVGLYFYFPLTQGTSLAFFIGAAAVVLPLLWAGWNALDWSNDYYFVTNQRVVWLEIVAGLYESRQEAPLATILSVGIESDQTGRIFGYGNVIVRTYTGPIPLRHVHHPQQLASMVEEHWRRSKIVAQKDDEAAMAKAIQAKLNPATDAAALPGPKSNPVEAVKRTIKPGFFQTFLSNIFQVRFDVGEVVTYRKHWFVLIENTWQQIVLLGLVVAFLIAGVAGWITFLTLDVVVLLALLGMLIIFGWWLYNYIDWHNDIYQVTADQIIDIERKPFGNENKKSAPLENILSIEYERVGVLGILFNFGTVYIKIGSTTFPFNQVFDPSQVQQDIFRRKLERDTKRKKAEKDAERERLATWIASYHRTYGGLPPNSSLPTASTAGENDQAIGEPQNSEDEAGKDLMDTNGSSWID